MVPNIPTLRDLGCHTTEHRRLKWIWRPIPKFTVVLLSFKAPGTTQKETQRTDKGRDVALLNTDYGIQNEKAAK